MTELQRTKLWAQLATLVAIICIALMIWNHFVQTSHGFAEGHEWLKWNRNTRVTFVSAYAEGIMNGYATGCHNATLAQNPEPTYDEQSKIAAVCDEKYPFSSKKDEVDYIDDITRF